MRVLLSSLCVVLAGCATTTPCPCLNVHHAVVDECDAPVFEENGAHHQRCHVLVYDEGVENNAPIDLTTPYKGAEPPEPAPAPAPETLPATEPTP